MHKKLLSEANFEIVKDFLYEMFDELKENNHKMYEELEIRLYKEIHGCHFTDWMLEKATRDMVNEDGSTGPHWSVKETTRTAESAGVSFKEYNEYDWNYVMNMIYSDYYGAVPDDMTYYIKMSIKFLQDKDAPKGKALQYYLSMKH